MASSSSTLPALHYQYQALENNLRPYDHILLPITSSNDDDNSMLNSSIISNSSKNGINMLNNPAFDKLKYKELIKKTEIWDKENREFAVKDLEHLAKKLKGDFVEVSAKEVFCLQTSKNGDDDETMASIVKLNNPLTTGDFERDLEDKQNQIKGVIDVLKERKSEVEEIKQEILDALAEVKGQENLFFKTQRDVRNEMKHFSKGMHTFKRLSICHS